MRSYSHVCGIVFNPIENDYVDVCEECEGTEEEAQEERETASFYLGQCGLIMDYLL